MSVSDLPDAASDVRRRAERASDDLAFALFRPHLFFYRPWTGSGEVTGPNGKRIAGFTVSGEGRARSREGHVVQEWRFDNGLSHVTEWKVLSTDGRDYRAVDVRNGTEARGRQVGESFEWVMKVKGPTPFGQRTIKITTVYRLVSPVVAEAHTVSTVFGFIPINRMRATYRRVNG